MDDLDGKGPRTGPMSFDWSIVANYDPKKLNAQQDFNSMSEIVSAFNAAQFSKQDFLFVNNPTVYHLLRLLQVILRYLMNSIDLTNRENDEFKESNESLSDKTKSLQEKVKKLQGKIMKLKDMEKCPSCGMKFKNYSYLDRHITSMHPNFYHAWLTIRKNEDDDFTEETKHLNDQIDKLKETIRNQNSTLQSGSWIEQITRFNPSSKGTTITLSNSSTVHIEKNDERYQPPPIEIQFNSSNLHTTKPAVIFDSPALDIEKLKIPKFLTRRVDHYFKPSIRIEDEAEIDEIQKKIHDSVKKEGFFIQQSKKEKAIREGFAKSIEEIAPEDIEITSMARTALLSYRMEQLNKGNEYMKNLRTLIKTHQNLQKFEEEESDTSSSGSESSSSDNSTSNSEKSKSDEKSDKYKSEKSKSEKSRSKSEKSKSEKSKSEKSKLKLVKDKSSDNDSPIIVDTTTPDPPRKRPEPKSEDDKKNDEKSESKREEKSKSEQKKDKKTDDKSKEESKKHKKEKSSNASKSDNEKKDKSTDDKKHKKEKSSNASKSDNEKKDKKEKSSKSENEKKDKSDKEEKKEKSSNSSKSREEDKTQVEIDESESSSEKNPDNIQFASSSSSSSSESNKKEDELDFASSSDAHGKKAPEKPKEAPKKEEKPKPQVKADDDVEESDSFAKIIGDDSNKKPAQAKQISLDKGDDNSAESSFDKLLDDAQPKQQQQQQPEQPKVINKKPTLHLALNQAKAKPKKDVFNDEFGSDDEEKHKKPKAQQKHAKQQQQQQQQYEPQTGAAKKKDEFMSSEYSSSSLLMKKNAQPPPREEPKPEPVFQNPNQPKAQLDDDILAALNLGKKKYQ